jgi:erythromycin esterase-like protein
MARSGRRTITIEAPVLITSNKVAVWMDEDWVRDFFDWLRKNKFKISAMNHMQNKIKLTFVDAKECTMFGLKYAGKKK